MADKPGPSVDTADKAQKNPPQAPALEQSPDSFQHDQDTARFTRWVKRPVTASTDSHAPSKKRQHYMSRPSCTHVDMVKLYGGWHVCHLCGRRPRLGFVYACEQDHTHPLHPDSDAPTTTAFSAPCSHCLCGPCSLHDSNGKSRSKPSKPPKHPILSSHLLSAKDVDTSGLSNWIINASYDGHYTKDQIRAMIDQKAHVRNVIASEQAHHHHNQHQHTATTSAVIDKLASLGLQHLVKSARSRTDPAPGEPRVDSPDTNDSQTRAARRAAGICDFKVCHTCRPVSRDRVWISFEAALKGLVPMPSQWHPFTMPVVDMHTMRTLGLRTPPREGQSSFHNSPDIEAGSASHDDCQSSTSSTGGSSSGRRAVKSQPSSVGFRSSLRKSLIDLLNDRQTGHLPDASSPLSTTLATAPSEVARLAASSPNVSLDEHISHLESRGLDLELWRALAEEQQNTAAATVLPGEDDSRELIELLDSQGPDEGFDDAEMDRTEIAEGECLIRNGEKNALGLGVTLTEEAVGNHEPDFIIASI